MYIRTKNIVLRGFERKDAENLYAIVREPAVYRFMPDWTDGYSTPQNYYEMIDYFRTHQDSTDFSNRRAYAITLPDTDEMIGMVGIGLKEMLNEVEVSYFMSEKFHRKGYTKEAVEALIEWCFKTTYVAYLILTINCANKPSNTFAEKCGFELLEKRIPAKKCQSIDESDSYFYYRRSRV